ncbi:MAG TPA: VCBS repeat-containing protein [Methanoregula sp.]|nr:VCBS repeat-containing protein [Methanoregula sp.]
MQKKDLFHMVLIFTITCVLAVTPVAAATTDLHVVKYANDGTTVLSETTVNSTWMEENLPIYGDGITHYFHQGPNFTYAWDENEADPAILTKDMGAVKGSNLKDICDLAGGMSPADNNVTIIASDGFSKRFAYTSIYTPPARAGPIVITWYKDGLYVNGTATNYTSGMRNVMFADTSVNPWGNHIFGLYDMNQTYPLEFQYFYQGNPNTPSTTGLSVQNINRIFIYSNQAPPETLFDGTVDLTSGETFNIEAYNNPPYNYTVSRTTPLGALDAVANVKGGWTINVTDKRWSSDGVLLLDDFGPYLFKKPNVWYAYVNGVYKDGYGNHANGLNVIELANNDQVNFYYAPNKDPNPVLNATDVVKIKIHLPAGTTDSGVFRSGQWILDYGMDRTVDRRFNYGLATDTPLVGDFNNDGTMDVGVFRSGQWILDYGMDRTVDRRFNYGLATDTPLVGDFNNDGTMDVGVFRSGQWILDYGMDRTVDRRFNYGLATDTPLVGDFNNDGTMDVGVFRSGQWILDYGMDRTVDRRFNYGLPTDLPLVGKWL